MDAEAALDLVLSSSSDYRESYQDLEDIPIEICRVCGKTDERLSVQFSAVFPDPATTMAAPHVTTFSEDIFMHIFCGKTAAILDSSKHPELEILTQPGIKNKHGIGVEINSALERTRSAIGQDNKEYFISKEFEAHLAVARNKMASNLAVPIQHMSAAPRNVALKTQSAPRRRARPNLKRNIIRSNNDYAVRVPSSTASSSAASSVSSHAAEPIRCQTCDCGADVFGCGADNDVWKEHLSSKEHLDWMEQNGMISYV